MKATRTWSNNWMSAIRSGARLSELSIPGTHDSCARFECALGRTQCQWLSITQQLDRGIRFLDIRCRYEADAESGRAQGTYFPIYHGTTFQNIFFEDVQAQCIAFLSENPSEFILMNVQMEYAGDEAEGHRFRKKFLELAAPCQATRWYLKQYVPPLIPTVEECRGRIVLIRACDPHAKQGWSRGSDSEWPDCAQGGGLEWNGFNIDGESSNALFRTQNGWKGWGENEKGDKVQKYIETAESFAASGLLTLNFASYTSDVGPGPNAQSMNARLRNFLRQRAAKRNGDLGAVLGVIPLDFVGNTGDGGDSLENLIIERQEHREPQSSYGGMAEWSRLLGRQPPRAWLP